MDPFEESRIILIVHYGINSKSYFLPFYKYVTQRSVMNLGW